MVEVTAVRPLENYRLELTFNNGERRVFDAAPYLDRGIFTQLKDTQYFRKARVSLGTVTWPGEQDFAPETLYIDSKPAQ